MGGSAGITKFCVFQRPGNPIVTCSHTSLIVKAKVFLKKEKANKTENSFEYKLMKNAKIYHLHLKFQLEFFIRNQPSKNQWL